MPTTVAYDDIYKTRWLKADDIPDEDLVLTIQDVNSEGVGPEKEMKLILDFKETDKGLILNKTNAKTISDRFGKDPNAWIGKRITLYSTEVDFAGKTTLAIRVRLKNPPKPVVQPEEAESDIKT